MRPISPLLFARLTRTVADAFVARIEVRLDDLVSRLKAAPTRSPRRRRSSRTRKPIPTVASVVRLPVPVSMPSLQRVVAGLRVNGDRDAVVIHGHFRRPGTGEAVAHSWVESGDSVHDPSFENGRKVWPKELFYFVFRATGNDP